MSEALYPSKATLYTKGPHARAGRDRVHRVRVLGAVRTLTFPLPYCTKDMAKSGFGQFRLVSVLVEGESAPRDIAAERLDREGA